MIAMLRRYLGHLRRLERFSSYDYNWDSYGARKMTPEAKASARRILEGRLTVFAKVDGGVIIELEDEGAELIVNPDGSLDFDNGK